MLDEKTDILSGKRKASPDLQLDASLAQQTKQWCPTSPPDDVKPVLPQQYVAAQFITSHLPPHTSYPSSVPQRTSQTSQQYIPPSPVKAQDYSNKGCVDSGEVDGFSQANMSSPIKQADIVSDAFPTHVITPQERHVPVVGGSQLTTSNTQVLNSDALMFDQVGNTFLQAMTPFI